MDRLVVGIAGMSCQGCVSSVTKALQALPGVTEVKVTLEPAQAEIVYDPQKVKPSSFKTAIEEAGFDVV